MVRIILILVVIMGSGLVMTAIAGEKRYVVPSHSMGVELREYPLWTTAQFPALCARAMVSGTKADQKMFCETGVGGLKPTVGMLATGTEVEVLDSRECQDMVSVRVLTGSLKGHTGCIVGTALSSVKP